MQTDYFYPEIGDRSSPKEWIERDKPVLIESAIARKREILGQPSRALLSPEIDAMVRAAFPIRLDTATGKLAS